MKSPVWVIALATMLAGSAELGAQRATISGKVLAREGRLPIDGAVVSVIGTKLTATTSPTGSFSIVGIAPGKYTLSAKRIGYTTVEVRGFEVEIDRTRELTFELRASGADSVEYIDAEPEFFDPKIVTSLLTLNRDRVLSLPSVTLPGALGVNGGYVQVARSSANITVADFRRGVTSLPSVRGARADATGYLLDGIEVSNPIFGTHALLAEPLASSSVSFYPAHFDAEYGNAMSGLVTQALREGGDRVEGAFEYQTTWLAGAFSDAAAESRAHALRGYVAGPMPVRPESFRFSFAAHSIGDRLNVEKHLCTPTSTRGRPSCSFACTPDREAFGDCRTSNFSWHGAGDNGVHQGVAKFTYAASPTLRFSLVGLGQLRTVNDVEPDFLFGDSVAPSSMGEKTRLLIARAEKRFARAHVSLSLSNTRSERETCSFWIGVCIEDRMQRLRTVGEEQGGFFPPRETPYARTGPYYGGEQYSTHAVRADATLQATDHVQAKLGLYAARHDLEHIDVTQMRVSQLLAAISRNVYRVKPTEFASYVQSAFEYDVITIRAGVRFDYAMSPGTGMANPLNLTNGTDAADVCNGTVHGINETPFRYGETTGVAACQAAFDAGNPTLYDSATRMAQRDDFRAATPMTAFSPRLGVSLPVTEESALFFNFGRYARKPLYHDMYRNTGTGSVAGMGLDADRMCDSYRTMPGTNECIPAFAMPAYMPEFVGNPLLPFQVASLWEAGFRGNIGRMHAISGSYFSNTQNRLPTLHFPRQSPDPGATYGGIGDRAIRVVLPTGSILSTGISLTFRRRLHNALRYSFNYTWSRSTEFGARPDLIAEALASAAIDTNAAVYDNTVEVASRRNKPHLFNAEASLQWRDRIPSGTGKVGSVLLKNSQTVVTLSAASGSNSRLQADCFEFMRTCPGQTRRVVGTGTIVNLLYSKAITTQWPVWSLVVRVQNVLNSDDGSTEIVRTAEVFSGITGPGAGTAATPLARKHSNRRILTGMTVTF